MKKILFYLVVCLAVLINCLNVSAQTGVVDFEYSNTCENVPISFTNLSTDVTNYSWDFGDGIGTSMNASPSYVYNNTGTYIVTLEAEDVLTGTILTETQIIEIVETPSFSLGNDIDICAVNLTLGAPSNFTDTSIYDLLWTGGVSGTSFNVQSSGTYWLTIGIGGCEVTDTVIIALLPPVAINLGEDITTCDNTVITLDAGTGQNFMYNWSTTETTQTIEVSTSGNYSVTVDNGLCSATDNINITITNPTGGQLPVLDLGPDMNLCFGETIVLTTGIYNLDFTWSTGETEPVITVNTSGTYTVSTESNGCVLSDEIVIDFFESPMPNLGEDREICPQNNEVLVLEPGDFESYSWLPFLETTPTIAVNQADTFAVTVTNEFGCTATDEIIITTACNAQIFAPTAFSPNNDGENDIFKPTVKFIDNYLLQIFNRYGELVFQTTDMTEAWDGNFKNLPQPVSVYIYNIRYVTQQLETKFFKGNLTLVR